MTESLDASVVITAYNNAGTLGEQLDALAAQRTTARWELIIADNGSTDGTAALVDSRAAAFPVPLRRVDASAVAGVPHARNAGVAAAVGSLILFCDADDRVAEDWVEQGIRALDGGADCAGGALRELRTPFDPGAPLLPRSAYVATARGGGVIGCNMVMRRSLLQELGGFDETLPRYGGDDSEFSLRMNLAGARIIPAPDMVVYFRATTDPRQILRKVYLGSLAEVEIWRRHPELYAAQLERGYLLWETLSLPRTLVAARRRGGNRALARQAVRWAAHLRAGLGPRRH
ncbi:glycosyltransferase [Brachybacterium sp. EF45031]|uniref:glycosyltransferase n=1 Tax=Brachybacterium sillae TaxID=2810536 RepID=UPI00217D87F1|nr:glycosyltransferase [Brachybacterium sillae]MCS6711625.1 glycosyltransferase [Brachybacterium sillae]